jgi:hypothetical protein
VIGVENDRHQQSAFELATANESPKANNLCKRLVASEVTHDLSVPRRGTTFGQRGLERFKLLLDPRQTRLEFLSALPHAFIVVATLAIGKVVRPYVRGK